MPVVLFFVLKVPRFAPVFDKLSKHDMLPTGSEVLMSVNRFCASWYYIPLVFVAAFVLWADTYVVRYCMMKGKGKYYWFWFSAVCLSSIPTFLLIQFLLVIPVFKMGEAVE